jgi:hypothetical protein
MAYSVSKLSEVRLNLGQRLFVLANEGCIPSRKEALRADCEWFGGQIDGVLVWQLLAAPHANFHAEISSKTWPEHIRRVFAKGRSPYLLVLGGEFSNFDPIADQRWCFVWLGQPAIGRRLNIGRVFEKFAQAAHQDIFAFLSRKSDGTDPDFPRGSIADSRVVAEAMPSGPVVRANALRNFGIDEEFVRRIIAAQQIAIGAHGWKMKVGTAVSLRLKVDNNLDIEPKSAYDRLRKDGVFDRIEAGAASGAQ